MKRPGAILLAAALWLQPLAAVAQLPADGQLAIIDLGALVKPAAINNVGQVVGQNAAGRAFLWDEAGGMLDLGTLGGAESFANDINDSGVVVGWSQDSSSVKKAFRWDSVNGMVNLDVLDYESAAEAINARGHIVGWGTNGTNYGSVRWKKDSDFFAEFLFTSHVGNQKATSINDRGEIVGLLLTNTGTIDESYYWAGASSSGEFTDILDLDYFVTAGINNSGLTAGSADSFSAFLQVRDESLSLAQKIARNDVSSAYGINDLGQIVGASGASGYVYDVATGLLLNANEFDLTSVEPADPQFESVSIVTDINNWHFLAGTAAIDGLPHGFVANLTSASFRQAGEWNVDSDGLWSKPANWLLSVPDAPGATASFTTDITAPRTVTADRPLTVGRIEFDNSAPYIIAGSERITLRTPVGDAAIDVISGSHRISAPLTLADNTVVTIRPADVTLSIAGAVDARGMTLTKNGAGTLAIGQVRAAALLVNAGAVALLFGDGASVIDSLAIAGPANSPTARFDLSNSAAVIDHAGTSPAATARQQILAGRGGAGFAAPWNGNGITSSTVALANATDPESRSIGYAENAALPLGPYATFRGQPVDDTAVIIAYTRTGDANLDGVVNDDDVTIVGATYAPGVPNAHWALGDFDYNGFVDDDDVTLLGVFYDPNAPPLITPAPAAQDSSGIAVVPEPSTWLLATLAALAGLSWSLLRRRRSNR